MSYLDHAATTPLHPEVLRVMQQVLSESYGNPSSTHQWGRKAREWVEQARKSMAQDLGCKAAQMLFTSGATESIQAVIMGLAQSGRVHALISNRMEHQAVLQTLEVAAQRFGLPILWVNNDSEGRLDLDHFEVLLHTYPQSLVALMHVNNETGVIHAVDHIGTLCRRYSSYYLCDCTQSVGKTPLQFNDLAVDFALGSAHKFNGPKGVGFLYAREPQLLPAWQWGGEQEKGLRAGTEAVHQCVGMATALHLALEALSAHITEWTALQQLARTQLLTHFPGVQFHGHEPFMTLLHFSLPWPAALASMLVFRCDLAGVAVSRGSACQSGSSRPSHVLAQMCTPEQLQRPSLRISWGLGSTQADIDALIHALRAVAPSQT